MRLTRENIKKILEQNEGFCIQTNSNERNFSESRVYTITNGKLVIRSKSKSSWAGSRKTVEWEGSEK